MAWLDDLQAELKAIDPDKILEPAEEVFPEHTIIGEVKDMDIKKLYTLLELRATLMIEKRAELLASNHINNSAERDRLESEFLRLQGEVNVLRELFWVSIRNSLGVWNSGLDLCKNWKIARCDCPKKIRESLEKLRRLLMSGPEKELPLQ